MDKLAIERIHLLYPRNTESLGYEDVGKLAVGDLRKTTVRFLPLHVDEVQLLHSDVCILMEQLIELPNLQKRILSLGNSFHRSK